DLRCSIGCVSDVAVYEFGKRQNELQTSYRAKYASWQGGKIVLLGNVEKNSLAQGKVDTEMLDGAELAEQTDPFTENREKPNHLNIAGLKKQIADSDSELDRRNLTVT